MSLLAPSSSLTRRVSPTVEPSSNEAPVEVANASRIVPPGLKLEASVLRDPMLVSKLLSGLFLSIDANELLGIPRREMRRGAVDCFI